MKHTYSINLAERQNVYFVLAAVSFGCSVLIGQGLNMTGWTPPTWLDIPGAFTLFGLLSLWFDRQLWCWPFIRRLGISTPILKGEWIGSVSSSFSGHAEHYPITVTIHQDWTSIDIYLSADYSESQSTVAAINIGPESTLVYCYANRPKGNAAGTMHAHEGTATLHITASELSGDYYSGRDRTNSGRIVLRRKQAALQSGVRAVG